MIELTSEMITFPSNGHMTPGYLTRPNDGKAYPGVVVLQEWWGLVPHIKEVADRLARAGFVALAPDLYHGQAAEEPDEARKLAMGMDRARAVLDVQSAAKYLQSAHVATPKIGVVGWCMGGGLSLMAAAQDQAGAFGASVVFYGRPLTAEEMASLKAPVLGLFGELDGGIPVEMVKGFEQALQTLGIPHDITIYEGAQHAFFNDSRPQIYHPTAAASAWEKMLAWYGRYLV